MSKLVFLDIFVGARARLSDASSPERSHEGYVAKQNGENLIMRPMLSVLMENEPGPVSRSILATRLPHREPERRTHDGPAIPINPDDRR